MNAFIRERSEPDLLGIWEQFCKWITSTNNRIYIKPLIQSPQANYNGSMWLETCLGIL